MMKSKITLLFFCMFSFFSFAQINDSLKKELDEIHYYDQELRKLFDNRILEEAKDEILSKLKISKKEFQEESWNLINKQDSLNFIRIAEIFDIYGYPGKTLVGEKAATTAWLVIQHSDSIEKYFPIIKKAGEEGEIPMRLVAMMEDRLLMYQQKEQIYGTQIHGEEIEGKHISIVWPIQDVENVNQRRKDVGFSETVEEYAQYFEIEYKVYTLEDLRKMRND